MSTVLDRDAVKSLCRACDAALDAFIVEADKTCAMYRNMERPPSAGDRTRILEQQTREDEAYQRYQKTRLALFRSVRESHGNESYKAGSESSRGDVVIRLA